MSSSLSVEPSPSLDPETEKSLPTSPPSSLPSKKKKVTRRWWFLFPCRFPLLIILICLAVVLCSIVGGLFVYFIRKKNAKIREIRNIVLERQRHQDNHPHQQPTDLAEKSAKQAHEQKEFIGNNRALQGVLPTDKKSHDSAVEEKAHSSDRQGQSPLKQNTFFPKKESTFSTFEHKVPQKKGNFDPTDEPEIEKNEQEQRLGNDSDNEEKDDEEGKTSHDSTLPLSDTPTSEKEKPLPEDDSEPKRKIEDTKITKESKETTKVDTKGQAKKKEDLVKVNSVCIPHLRVFHNGMCLSTDATVTCHPDQSITIDYINSSTNNKEQVTILRQMTSEVCNVKQKSSDEEMPLTYSIEIYMFIPHWYAFAVDSPKIKADATKQQQQQMSDLNLLCELFVPNNNSTLYKTKLYAEEPDNSYFDFNILKDFKRMGVHVSKDIFDTVDYGRHPLRPPLNEMEKWYKHLLESKEEIVPVSKDCKNWCEWKVSRINEHFRICSTYGRYLAVPSRASDSLIAKVAAKRSKGRLPILSYLYNGAVIARCSQPTRYGSFSNEPDKVLVGIIKDTSPSNSLLIADARAKASAYGNLLKPSLEGGGLEMTEYKGCSYTHLDIGNIHSLRESLKEMLKQCAVGKGGEQDWFKMAKSSGWRKQVELVLKGASVIVNTIDQNGKSQSVLVHCSDGWDRTSQLVSLASICLDSYYRSYNGLEVLLNREWVWAGHKLEERTHRPLKVFVKMSGYSHSDDVVDSPSPTEYHSQWHRKLYSYSNFKKLSRFMYRKASKKLTKEGRKKSGENEEISPIFMLFLDCLGHLIKAYPDAFEYDQRVLHLLLEQLYLKRWENSEKQRAHEFEKNNSPRFYIPFVIKEARNSIKNRNTLRSISMDNYLFMFGTKGVLHWPITETKEVIIKT